MKILGRICRISAEVAGWLLMAIAVIVTVDVLRRFITGYPLKGSFEFCIVGFVGVTFLALGAVQYSGRQMKMDILINRIEGKGRYLLEAILNILPLFIFVVILLMASEEWTSAYRQGSKIVGGVKIPTIVHLSFVMYGTLLVSVVLIALLVGTIWKISTLTKNRRR